ncbi:activator-dependent family glycosyltransferase [Streptomyces althioticus]|uniref:Activator-dependent family glycosyltransferase n=1 Tax=Streptomyces althioticus TaxID=83380 RepID=A0ABZ1Y1H1_9ACTN|nr:glycosyl transferase [Streptomyces griseorubens]
MRVLFTTFAAKSHVHIHIPLAWALRSAGHDVCVASQPDLTEYVSHTGLTAVGVGEPLGLDVKMAGANRRRDAEEPADDPDFLADADLSGLLPERRTYTYLRNAFELMASYVYPSLSSESMIEDLVAFARRWKPDLVIWDTHTFAGAIAATVTGAAHARLLFGADLLGYSRQLFLRELDRLPAGEGSDPLADWLGQVLDVYGEPFTQDVVMGHWTMDGLPSGMRLPVAGQHHVPVRFVPYNGPSVLPDWLGEPTDRPRVCLTLGSTGREVLGADRASVADLLDAVADVDAEVVATLSAEQLAGVEKVPENVRVVDFVPLDALLPSCSVIVHQGGAGTFQNSQMHGVPQIIVPDLLWDSEYKMRYLRSTGSGLAVPDVDRFDAAQLRDMIVRVLTDRSFERNAAGVRRELLSMPTPRDIVPTLVRLTTEYH